MRTSTVVVAVLVLLAGVVPAGIAGAAGPAASDLDARAVQSSADTPGELDGVTTTQQTTCAFPVTVTDATGTQVRIDDRPERIVSLSPSAAQTLWAIEAESQVVGVTQFAAYLDGAEAKTNISGAGQTAISTEKVVGTTPDLVLAPNVVPDETVQALRDSGLTVYKAEFAGTLGAVVEKTRLYGQLTGNCESADATADRMESELATVAAATEGEDRPRVLYTFFGFTAGEGTFVDEIITTAGGTNVASEANITGYKQISPETVVAQDPEWIVLNSDGPQVPQNDAYNSTTAVQEGNVLVLNGNYLSQPAPRVIQPVRALAKALHPEAYAQANATATPTATPTASPTPTATPGTTTQAVDDTPATTTSVPGFGVLVALVSMLGAGLLARRAS
ncbi:PGF-CTERM-anchored ABC transporter substrate-binding protein [Salinirubrum litoreum]|uniref:PGF-CTERM-anchored ABC transporter substrate-binding protein n=1 Tax=Salinirubrum litoreum TaxID=1126234 RepID=A0ABD5RCU8_9EURY|nr:PGF-CTERM-anchored ABC transporter substrate-binding protein [Salinirubrum litoreum]